MAEFPPNCEVFVDDGGLKFLFAAFMGKVGRRPTVARRVTDRACVPGAGHAAEEARVQRGGARGAVRDVHPEPLPQPLRPQVQQAAFACRRGRAAVPLPLRRYMRLLRKFEENHFEKVERLIELVDKYSERVERAVAAARKEHADDAVRAAEPHRTAPRLTSSTGR
jgi:hypothetical protein